MNTTQYTANSTPVQIYAPQNCYHTVVVTASGNDVYLGSSTVTTSTGIPLQKGVLFEFDVHPFDSLYAVTATGTAVVSVMFSTP